MPSFCGYDLRSESSYHGQTAQFIAVVTQNLPRMTGEVMQAWIQNPRLLQRALQRTLLAFPPKLDFKKPKIWKTIVIDQKEIDLGIVALDEFDPDDLVIPEISRIHRCARKNGLEPCSVEIAKKLAEQYTDQPADEKLFISFDSTDPLNNEMFCLEAGELTTVEAIHRDGWSSGPNLRECDQFVFVLPRK